MKNSDFITGRVPITKEEVRAVSIMKLDLVNAKRFKISLFVFLYKTFIQTSIPFHFRLLSLVSCYNFNI